MADVSRALATSLAVAWLCVGCGATSANHAATDTSRAPLSDQDPVPYHPRPRADAHGAVHALSVSSHEDSAVQLALDFLGALRDADLARARGMMAEDMFRLGEREFYRPMNATSALAQLRVTMARARASGARPPPVARLVHLQQVEVTPPRPTSTEVSRQLRPNDSLVTFPTTPEGRVELSRWYPGWAARVRVLVRTSGTPQVIGF